MGYILTVITDVWETIFQAMGVHLTLGLGGILFLGVPAVFWCGAYGYAVAAHAGVPLALACAIGIGMSIVAGFVYAFFYARMSNESFAVITLASMFAMSALISSWDAVTGGVLGIAGVPRLIPGQTLGYIALMETCLACVALAAESFLAHSTFGRSLRALKENKTALIALGTSAKRTGQVVLMITCVLLGIAGMLTASRIQFLDPSLGGLFLLIQTLTIAIVTNSPKTLRFLGTTVVVVLIPEALRFFNLPNSILGYARNSLYSIMLIVLIYYVLYNAAVKRNV